MHVYALTRAHIMVLIIITLTLQKARVRTFIFQISGFLLNK